MELADIEWATHILRNLWLKMNDMVFNKKFKSPTNVVQETKVEYEDYRL